MNIPNLKYYNNRIKKINLTSYNNTPIKIKRFSYSNSLTSKQNKPIYRNRKIINDCITNNNSYSNISENTKKYIFNKYKVSPLIAIFIYEKSINNFFEFIKKRLPLKIFIEFKKKYISFVSEELHILNKHFESNISDKDIINLDIKLFVSQNNSSILNYNKLIDSYRFKLSDNSNSLFQLNKMKIPKKGKISPFNSFNSGLKNKNKLIINSSKIFIRPKNKIKNICNTEYNNKVDKEKLNIKKSNKKEITKFKPLTNKRKNITDFLKNTSTVNGSFNNQLNNLFFSTKDSKKKLEIKDKVINSENNTNIIFRKLPVNKTKKIIKQKNIDENKKEEKENNTKIIEMKDSEKNSIKQLNLIKENLDDNLKNMFNFSYGYFLNNERESDSSKSYHDLYRFNNNDYNSNNFTQN